jgi:hypothetical protein
MSYEQPATGIARKNKRLIDVLLERNSELETNRRRWEEQWRSIRELVRPEVPEFSESVSAHTKDRGRRLHNAIFDSTAPWASETLAAGLHSFLLSPSERWFTLGVKSIDPSKLARTEREYLEETSDKIYHHFTIPEVNFNPAIHEGFLDLVSFGTAVIMETFNPKTGSLLFRAFPLSDCFIDEDADGEVDTVYRHCRMTLRQIMQMWPDARFPDKKKEDDKFTVVHAVQPRTDRDISSRAKTNMKWAEFYFIKEEEMILEEGGFESFPYLVPRWSKLAGEKYGRSPAMQALPDIQMVNRMMREILVAAQLANRPPVIMPEDGFILPLSHKPGAMWFKSVGAESPEPFNSGSRVDIPFEIVQETRNAITRAFLLDFLQNDFKKERQTAFEISDRRDEKLRSIAPTLQRLQSELLGKLLKRSIYLFEELEYIDPAPFGDGTIFDIVYNSPASRAQLGTKAIEIARFIQDMAPLGQILGPEAFGDISVTGVSTELQKSRGISVKILKSDEEKQAEAQAQQQQQAMAMVPEAAGAMKDIADAQSKGLNLGI